MKRYRSLNWSMNYYSWEKKPSRHRNRYRSHDHRGGCLKMILIGGAWLLFIGVVVGLLSYGYLYYRFAGKVASYDLCELSNMERASQVYDRNGIPMGEIFIQHRIPISYDKIPKKMVDAIVSEEDNRFFEHHGVDIFGILRAAISNYRQGKIKQGASTVTQQLARNSFDLKERSFERKILEAFLSYKIENALPKEKIMELYLNKVYFGSGFYGVEAAAHGYFGKTTSDLSVGECAMLAGLLKSPNSLSPWHHLAGARKVRNFVLGRMEEMHFITEKEYQEAIDQPLKIRPRHHPFKISYALDMIRQQAIAALGYETIMNGGIRIETTFDTKLQATATEAFLKELSLIESNPHFHHPTYTQYHQQNQHLEDLSACGLNPNFPPTNYLQGALLTIDNQDGGILTMIGGRNFTHSEYNRALQGTRPAGTLFTPILAAAAYQAGLSPATIVADAPLDNHYVMIGGTTGILGEWGVAKKENHYEGPMTAEEAIARGKNAATVRFGFLLGLPPFIQMAKKLGIRPPIRSLANSYLGSSEVGLDDMTLAFSTFARGGTHPQSLHTITKMIAPDGSLLFSHNNQNQRALCPEAAYQTHALLQRALAENQIEQTLPSLPSVVITTGNSHSQPTNMAQQNLSSQDASANWKKIAPLLAGKSGTAYDFTDNWCVGYSSAITCGVWIGFDRPTSLYQGAFGKDLAQPVWQAVMMAAEQEYPPHPIKAPTTLYPVALCRSSGMLLNEHCTSNAPSLASFHPAEKESPHSNAAIQIETTIEQIPTTLCHQHGDQMNSHLPSQATTDNESSWPKATLAIDLSSITPISLKAPTLFVSDDPYQSLCSKAPYPGPTIPIQKATPKIMKATKVLPPPPEPTPSIAKAIPVLEANSDRGATPTPQAPSIMRAIAVGTTLPTSSEKTISPSDLKTYTPHNLTTPEIRKAVPAEPNDFPATTRPILPTVQTPNAPQN